MTQNDIERIRKAEKTGILRIYTYASEWDIRRNKINPAGVRIEVEDYKSGIETAVYDTDPAINIKLTGYWDKQ